MATYNELTYYVLDELKMISDDNHFQKEHIIFLLDKYRSFILKQRYADIKKEIPESNYQTICIDLEKITSFDGDNCAGRGYLRSVQEIPNTITIGNTIVSTLDYFQGNINYVSKERFKYAGNNRFLSNMIYSTIAPDSHLYIKSNSPQAYFLKKVRVTGIFEDSAKAAELSCSEEGDNTKCDVMEREYPLEESLIPPVLELIIKELGGAKYQAADRLNNASDELDKLANYIAKHLKKRGYTYDD